MALTKIQELTHSQEKQEPQPNPISAVPSWMWTPKMRATTTITAEEDDDESWEVRAFAEDTNNALGTTWPPRSYTCTFCRREFKSAQALGGHMNVHRRDRARLHQAVPTPGFANLVSNSTSNLQIPTQEISSNDGVCLLYTIPNPNGSFCPNATSSRCTGFPSSNLSISPFLTSYITSTTYPLNNFNLALPSTYDSIRCHSSNTELSPSMNNENHHESAIEDLDLELRLGCGSNPS